jgi:hypothetical protein
MTRSELKDRIRNGQATPGVASDLFEACWREIIAEDYPGARITDLMESKGSSDGLPAGVHARVMAMLDASRAHREQVRQLEESRPARTEVVPLEPRTAAELSQVLQEAGRRYASRTDDEAVRGRALDRDDVTFARPRPLRPAVPARPLADAIADARRLPNDIHALVARLLGGGR